ncbi:MAG: M16 family metallopeptidase [Butyricimonas paravirosa]
MNRNIEPSITEISRPSLWGHQQITLPNGIEIVYLHDPNQEVFKMDVVLSAGIYNQSRPVIASSMINMLNEGTRQHTSAEIAELFDYHGAYVDFNCGMHKAELSLISLNKYAPQTIRMLAEMTLKVHSRKKNWKRISVTEKQQHLVNIEKTSYLARMEFIYRMYGKEHPYANYFTLENFDQVTPELLHDFYRERVQASQCRIMLCGNVSDTVLQEVSQAFSPMSSNPLPPDKVYTMRPSSPGKYHVSKPDAVQTSIRIGKSGVTLLDEDYTYFQLLNMVLGGYFGSRLMSNIREEKGYTYGIGSYNVTMPQAAHWMIATDVNAEATEATITECIKEIRRLQEELVPEEELSLVKSYFNGELLRELDGVFSQSDALKHKLNYGQDNTFYLRAIDKIRSCTPEDIMRLAQNT